MGLKGEIGREEQCNYIFYSCLKVSQITKEKAVILNFSSPLSQRWFLPLPHTDAQIKKVWVAGLASFPLHQNLNHCLQRRTLNCHFTCTKSSRNLRLFLTMEMITLVWSFNWCRLVSIFISLWSFQEAWKRMKIRPLDSNYQLSQFCEHKKNLHFVLITWLYWQLINNWQAT